MKHLMILLLGLCPLISFAQGTLTTLDNMYSVVKGDTWESIAAEHGITVEALMSANVDVRTAKLKKGTLLILPEKPQQVAAAPVEAPQPAAMIRTTLTELKVAVMLPFNDPRMVEFYRGLLMAADKVRRGGTNIEFFAWNSGSTMSDIEPLLGKTSGMDLVIGPSADTQVAALAEACRESGTRLVLPFATSVPTQNYPLVYSVEPSFSVVSQDIALLINRFYSDRNYVVIKTGKADLQGHTLTETLIQSLAKKGVQTRSLNIDADDFTYESAFNQYRDNMIVIDDSSSKSFEEILSHLKDFRAKHANYRISLLGYPEWQHMQDHLRDFFSLDTYLVSTSYYNSLADEAKAFEGAYQRSFRKSVSTGSPSYAPLGYDLGQYFLGGIIRQADTFEQMQGDLPQQPLQNRFRFERNPSGMSFCNRAAQLIHFTTDEKIELIR